MSISGIAPSVNTPSANTTVRTADAPPPAAAAAGSDAQLRDLQQRALDGTLSPVQSGQLAQLMGREGGSAPVAAADRADAASGTKPKTVADFKLTNANAQDRADLKQALEYLQQTGPDGKPVSPTATKLLQQLPAGTKIEIIHDGNDAYSPSSDTIYWDPRSGLTTPNGTQSAALGLIHEMDHKANGLANPQPTGDDYDNTEEKRVITGSETSIAHDLGEPTRTDHRGGLEVMDSSIAHTDVKAAQAELKKVGEAVEDGARHLRDWFQHLFD